MDISFQKVSSAREAFGGVRWGVVSVLAALGLLGTAAQAQGGYVIAGDEEGDRATLYGLMQFRYEAAIEDSDSTTDDSIGFLFRRLRIGVKGETLGGKFGYEVEAETSGGDDFFLLDATFTFNPTENWRIRVGQFPIQFNREAIVAPYRLLAVDRSSQAYNINPYFFLRTQGVDVQYKDERQRAVLALHEGAESFNASWDDDLANIAVTLRYENAVVGDLSPFAFMNSFPGTPQSLMLGGGLHFEDREDDGFGEGGGERYGFTADINYMNDRFSAALIGTGHVAGDLNRTTTIPSQPEHLYGFVVQSGYFFTDDIEPFLRYEWATTSDEQVDDLSIITGGFNWFILGNAFKFSADASYVFSGVNDSFDRRADALLLDDEGGQVVLRAQIQIVF